MLIEKILETLPKTPVPIRDIAAGLHWTGVASRYCGLASSLWCECLTKPEDPDIARMQKMSAQELARFALSDNYIESSIGMAALNSLFDPAPLNAVELNAYDWLLQEGAGKNIAMIGHFPFAEKIQSIAKTLWILEKTPRPGDFPASENKNLVPLADIVAITGSTFVNHSIDEVLSYCNPNATVLILGPSTPLAPVLFDCGVSIISGSFVTDEEYVIESIRNGASMKHLKGIKRITMCKPLETA